jgi:hypothetical protein
MNDSPHSLVVLDPEPHGEKHLTVDPYLTKTKAKTELEVDSYFKKIKQKRDKNERERLTTLSNSKQDKRQNKRQSKSQGKKDSTKDKRR